MVRADGQWMLVRLNKTQKERDVVPNILLEMKNIVKEFTGGVRALDHVNIQVRKKVFMHWWGKMEPASRR